MTYPIKGRAARFFGNHAYYCVFLLLNLAVAAFIAPHPSILILAPSFAWALWLWRDIIFSSRP